MADLKSDRWWPAAEGRSQSSWFRLLDSRKKALWMSQRHAVIHFVFLVLPPLIRYIKRVCRGQTCTRVAFLETPDSTRTWKAVSASNNGALLFSLPSTSVIKVSARGAVVAEETPLPLCLVYTGCRRPAKWSASETCVQATELWVTLNAERHRKGPQPLLLICCSLPCRQPHLLLKVQDQFPIIHLDSTNKPSLPLLSRSLVPVCLFVTTQLQLPPTITCVSFLSQSDTTGNCDTHKYDLICHSRYLIFKKGQKPSRIYFLTSESEGDSEEKGLTHTADWSPCSDYFGIRPILWTSDPRWLYRTSLKQKWKKIWLILKN